MALHLGGSSANGHPNRTVEASSLEEEEEEEESGQLFVPDDNGHECAVVERSRPEPDGEDNDEAFGRAETKAVFWLRLVVLFVLVSSTIGVALGVFFYTSDAEYQRFQERFEGDASKVLDAVGVSLDQSLGSVDSFVVGMVSFARYANMTWPWVTLPDYAVQMAKVRSHSKAAVVVDYHLVTAVEQARWENYSYTNHGWLQECLDVQKRDQNYHGEKFSEWNRSSAAGIYTTGEGGNLLDGPYLPIWQSYPVVPIYQPYNWDGSNYPFIRLAFSEVFEKKRVVISKVSNIPFSDDPEEVSAAGVNADWIKDYISPEDDHLEPQSEIYYPIVDAASDAVSVFDDGLAQVEGDESSRVVGFLGLSFFWRDLIRNILPADSEGIVCVFSNTCGQTFTYEINGPAVHYLGQGDRHDATYNDMGISSDLTDLESFSASDRTYTGMPLSRDLCPYRLWVYPTAKMEEYHRTQNPVVLTVVAVLIFVFTSILFVIYDRSVERRQRKVLNTAVQSSANVSLLEERVRSRTRKLEESNQRLEKANQRVTQASAAQLQHFASMSHEIRTPLNCIVGLSSLLQETELNAMQMESIHMIVSSGELLRELVNDVLDYSKLESGNVDIEIRRINLQDTLNTVVRSMETKARSKHLAIRTSYDASVCQFVQTDNRRLQQILYNLLGNAVKFSKEGGVVELGVCIGSPLSVNNEKSYSPPRANDTAGARKELGDQVLRFVVLDHGKGVERKDFEKIFQPFLQGGEETELLYGGTGLGLAITTKLIQSMGGRITVESEEGKWSRFSVELPFDGAPFDIETATSKIKNSKVFLVSQDSEHEEQAVSIFDRFGLEVVTVSNLEGVRDCVVAADDAARDQSCVCLVHEDLYDKDAYELLSSHAKTVLVTFGPKYAVKESKDHYRCLTQVLPSVLVQGIISRILVSDETLQSSLREETNVPSMLPFHGLRILIAEDNSVNQKVLARMLNKLGIKNVATVDNGQQAVSCEASQKFDVVLMDYSMPVMDGELACRRICARTGGHTKPIIVFVTAHAFDSYEKECRAAGGSDFISKPFSLADIEQCLRRVCGGSRNESNGLDSSTRSSGSIEGRSRRHRPSVSSGETSQTSVSSGIA